MNATEQDHESRLLTLVSELAAEARPDGADLARGMQRPLDASFERDYGFDSLTRMELLHRVERTFGATFNERALAEVETPRDVLRELAGTPSAERAQTPPASSGSPSDAHAFDARVVARAAKTLTEALEWHAGRHPEQIHVRFYADNDDGDVVTYGALWNAAGRVAAGLAQRAIAPGEAVVIMLPTGIDYFAAFFGVLRAGGVPVPVYPPGRVREIEDHIRRHAKIVANARARLMITVPEGVGFSRVLASQVENLAGIVTVAELSEAALPPAWPEAKPGDTAFIQYTSGSTGDPKGVVLSHANLLANITSMGTALRATSDDVFVSWLPLYHDMGLIGAWLGCLVHGVPLILMSPLMFLARPARWLKAISRYRATLSGGPNFAYELCATRIQDSELTDLDLSSWRVAFNGAEPVSAQTIDAFSRRFAPFGFAASAMSPVYGLAENSVGLAFPPLGRGPRIDWIDRDLFHKTGRAEPAAPGASGAKAVPGCGVPIPGHQIRVVDESGREQPDRQEGIIEFQGPSSTSGYLRNPEANRALFDGAWLVSGDLGYTVDGEIHVTGRRKDMIIRAGRNIFPSELETAVGTLDGITQGAVAVFGSPDPANGTERLVIMAESRRAGSEAESRLVRAINELSLDFVGMPPDVVRLVPPRTVPKTSSGKIRRQAARAVFESGVVGGTAVRLQVARLAMSAVVPLLRRAARRTIALAYGAYVTVLGLSIAAFGWLATALLPVEVWRWPLLRVLIRLYCLAAGLRTERSGLAHLPRDGAFIVAANHSSYLDGPMLLWALHGRYTFVAKVELLKHWISRIFLNRIGTAFVTRFEADRGVSDIERIADIVRSGRSLVSFPEGTLSRMAGLLPFQLGAFLLSVRTGVPIVPVVVRGTRHALRDGTWVPRPGNIQVEVLAPIDPRAAASDDDGDEWRNAVELRARTRAAILARCGEPDLVNERPLEQLAAEARATESRKAE